MAARRLLLFEECQLRLRGKQTRNLSNSSCRTHAPRHDHSRPRRDWKRWLWPRRLYQESRQQQSTRALAVTSGMLSFLLAGLLYPDSVAPETEKVRAVDSTSSNEIDGPEVLPKFRMEEVKRHGPKSERPWIIYGNKVYDITDWVPAHPGGKVILKAAGGSIERFWEIFTIHKTQYVRDILEQYVVGQLHDDDLVNGLPEQAQLADPFSSDPERDPRLRLLTQKPCNAETPGDELAHSFLTPNETFYVRNHMWVPVVEEEDGDDHEISVELPNGDCAVYTIGDLKSRFKQHTITAVLQCSGNRRKDMTDHAKKTNGLQWTAGAISCAKWEGVRLRDVLADAGLSLDDPEEDAKHVQLSAMEGYGASIPIASAIDRSGDVLLAFKMNDQPMPRDHGFPVRAVVPGHVAARSVKWVNKIVVSDEESDTAWQRRDYKCFGPNETKQDWDKYKSIQHMPVTSAITRVKTKLSRFQNSSETSGVGTNDSNTQPNSASASPPSTKDKHIVELEGYAYSGGGHEIQRVDVSLDGGETWDQASLMQDDVALELGSKAWCWKRWRYEGEVLAPQQGDLNDPKSPQSRTFVVKATDDAYNTQPETYKSIYNLRGNLATAWHRVDYSLKP